MAPTSSSRGLGLNPVTESIQPRDRSVRGGDSPPHPAALPIEELLADCSFQRTRRSGPGGQHRNKVETAVIVTHVPSGIHAEANERRSQSQNRSVAIFRLRTKLALGIRRSVNSATAPTPLWCSRSQGGRLAVSSEHDDFPAVLAEALDQLGACRWDLRQAATNLKVTRSQLTRFLQQEPRAWQLAQRSAREGRSSGTSVDGTAGDPREIT